MNIYFSGDFLTYCIIYLDLSSKLVIILNLNSEFSRIFVLFLYRKSRKNLWILPSTNKRCEIVDLVLTIFINSEKTFLNFFTTTEETNNFRIRRTHWQEYSYRLVLDRIFSARCTFRVVNVSFNQLPIFWIVTAGRPITCWNTKIYIKIVWRMYYYDWRKGDIFYLQIFPCRERPFRPIVHRLDCYSRTPHHLMKHKHLYWNCVVIELKKT